MKQKGSSIIIILIIVTIVMFMLLSIAFVLIAELRNQAKIQNSVKAYYYAQAGLERGMYYDKTNTEIPNCNNPVVNSYGDGKWELCMDEQPIKKIKSLGVAGSVERKLETDGMGVIYEINPKD